VQTGASEDEIPESVPIDGIVRKPFDVPTLLAALRQALASRLGAAHDGAEPVSAP
jgi:hypothetical protein